MSRGRSFECTQKHALRNTDAPSYEDKHLFSMCISIVASAIVGLPNGEYWKLEIYLERHDNRAFRYASIGLPTTAFVVLKH